MKRSDKLFLHVALFLMPWQLLAFPSALPGIKNILNTPAQGNELRSTRIYAESSRRGFIGACITAAACTAANIQQATASSRDEVNDKFHVGSLLAISPTKTDATSEKSPTALQESISGFISGTAVSTVKTLVKYPLDTATVRLQMPNTPFTIRNLPALFDGSFQGISAPLISNIPAGAIFFAVKDAAKTSLKGSGLPKWAVTSVAVAAALPPYWLIRNPSEVVKTRLQIGAEGYSEGMSMVDAFKVAFSTGGSGNSTISGLNELYLGYSENILYGFPADIIKFVAYDCFSGGKKLSPADGAVYGALATAIAQLTTTPLDVLRNRIMADVESQSKSDADNQNKKSSYIDKLVKIAKEEGLSELFAGSSPRVAKAILSGALQFATYEETKKKITEMILKR